MKAKLLASRLEKGKGKDKTGPSTSSTAIASVGDNLSYLSAMHTVLGLTLWDMPLVINTGLPLELKGSLRH